MIKILNKTDFKYNLPIHYKMTLQYCKHYLCFVEGMIINFQIIWPNQTITDKQSDGQSVLVLFLLSFLSFLRS